MPFMIYSAKRAIKDLETIAQVHTMVKECRPSNAPLTINEIYVVVGEVRKSILVILEVGIDKPQFIHLWQKDIGPLIEAFNPRLHPEDHRIRLDQYCRIDDFDPEVYYTRY